MNSVTSYVKVIISARKYKNVVITPFIHLLEMGDQASIAANLMRLTGMGLQGKFTVFRTTTQPSALPPLNVLPPPDFHERVNASATPPPRSTTPLSDKERAEYDEALATARNSASLCRKQNAELKVNRGGCIYFYII